LSGNHKLRDHDPPKGYFVLVAQSTAESLAAVKIK